MSKRWRHEKRRIVDGKKITVQYSLLINGRLQGGVYLDNDDKTWRVDSYGFDRSWCGPVASLADGKAFVESKA